MIGNDLLVFEARVRVREIIYMDINKNICRQLVSYKGKLNSRAKVKELLEQELGLKVSKILSNTFIVQKMKLPLEVIEPYFIDDLDSKQK